MLVNSMFFMLLNCNTKLSMIPPVTFRNSTVTSWVFASPGPRCAVSYNDVYTSYGPMAVILEGDGISALNTYTRIWLIILRKRCFFIYYNLLICRGVKSLLMASGRDKSVTVYIYIILLCFKFQCLLTVCLFQQMIKIKKNKDKKIFTDFFLPNYLISNRFTRAAT